MTKSKFNIKTISIIIGVIGIALITPGIAQATVAQAIFRILGNIIMGIGGLAVEIAGKFFDGMMKIGFDSHKDVAEIGWKVCRDIANMTLILAMVVIAFATILRNAKYGIKSLLPKLIGVALFINFSMVFCFVFVDISNISANFFITGAAKMNPNYVEGKTTIANTLVTALNLAKVFTPGSCNGLEDTALAKCEEAKRMEEAEDALVGNESVGSIVSAAIFGFMILIVAAITLFAGGILLIMRVVFIWILIALAPLAIIGLIFPALNSSVWGKWSKTFYSWCIFAPVLAFFIWLATAIAVSQKLDIQNKLKMGLENRVSMVNTFFSTPDIIVGYCIILGVLIIGLITAKGIGVTGGDLAHKWTMKLGNKAKDWSKRTAMRPVKGGATMAGAGALNKISKLFGDKIGGRMRARATMMKQAWWEKDPMYQKFAKVMANADNKTVAANLATMGPKGTIAAKEAWRRPELIRELDPEKPKEKAQLEHLSQRIRSIGDPELLQKFKELRADVLTSDDEINTTISKMAQEGNIGKIAAMALKNQKVVTAIAKFASPVQLESLRKQSDAHKDNFNNTLKGLVEDGRNREDKVLEAYASQTGSIVYMSEKQLETFAKKAGADGLKRIKWDDGWSNEKEMAKPENKDRKEKRDATITNIKIIANNLAPNQAGNIVSKLNFAEVAKIMVEHLNEINPTLVENDYLLKGVLGKKTSGQQFDKDAEDRRKQQGWDT